MTLAPNTVLQNRYRIVRQLGQGGMGTVYEAIDERLKSIVAIKESLGEGDEDRRAFEREANLLANLRHPALPKVIDHFVEDNQQFLVMEFIQGTDLAKLLALRGHAFSPEEVIRWGDLILGVLDYLHRRNPPILHRDIKPANLKLDEDGELFLLDFGLAKGFAGQNSRMTTSGTIFGYTPNYAPLEQIQGTGIDTRTDLHSLSATLYHLITNLPPLDVLTRLKDINNGQQDPLRPARELNHQVPKAVSDVLLTAMAISSSHRYKSAAEMRKALQDAVQSEFSRETKTVNLPWTTSELPPTIVVPIPEQKPPKYEPSLPQKAPLNWTIALIAVLLALVFFLAVSLFTGDRGSNNSNNASAQNRTHNINTQATTNIATSPSLSPSPMTPSVAGTAWQGVTTQGAVFRLEFKDGGKLIEHTLSSFRDDGVWTQQGNKIMISMPRGKYEENTKEGIIEGTEMKGFSIYKSAGKLIWTLYRLGP